ncbi:MAG: L,D-transpeptidase [Pseudomonadota bacterium]
MFSSSDPALANVSEYGARFDNGFDIAAVPLDKVDKRYYRQRVKYRTKHKPGTVVVDPHAKFLYVVEAGGKAMRYGIGVGREGFEWSGEAHIGFKRVWPKWTPPVEMIEREPHLAKYCADCGGMPGGPKNPLGARALYLVANGEDTLYRLHGTPQWNSIGTAASSGCIRLMNQDVIDLYNRVPTGAKVVVLS